MSLCVLLSAASCAELPADSEDPLDPEIGETTQPVVGGTSATDCQWPSTVLVSSKGLCTGTLIHPRVVTSAAHCIQGGAATIGFGSSGGAGSFSVKARCVAGANGETGVNSSKDWAYCILPEDPRVAKVPVTPPLVGCEADLVRPGASAWVVGYGATWSRGSAAGKRQVEVTINAFDKVAPGTIDVGDRTRGGCHGDSGGPLYVKVTRDGKDYGVRVAGSTSGPGASFCDCSCSTTYISIKNHVRAIERDEGIDVTPCTDADGNWDPSEACRDFASAPEQGTGSYPQCSLDLTPSPIESCGPNLMGSADAGSDAGVADAGAADGGVADGGMFGGGVADGGLLDAGPFGGADAGFDAGIWGPGMSYDAGVAPPGSTLPSDAGAFGGPALDAGFPVGPGATPDASGITPPASPDAGLTWWPGGPPVVRGGRRNGCAAASGTGDTDFALSNGLWLLALVVRRRRSASRASA